MELLLSCNSKLTNDEIKAELKRIWALPEAAQAFHEHQGDIGKAAVEVRQPKAGISGAEIVISFTAPIAVEALKQIWEKFIYPRLVEKKGKGALTVRPPDEP